MQIRKIILGTCCLFSLAMFETQDAEAARHANLQVSVEVQKSCTLTTAQHITFDPIVTAQTTQNDKQGSLSIKCSENTRPSLTLKHQGGTSDFNSAYLKNESSSKMLQYTIHKSSSRTDVYAGDNYYTGELKANTETNIDVYARLVGEQDAPEAGIYKDTIIAEIKW